MRDDAGVRSTLLSRSGADHPGPTPCTGHEQAKSVGLFSRGWNCCDIAKASRAAVLIDGAAYFRQLDSVLRRARRSISIIGWDFDGRIRLRPDLPPEDSPPLGDLLRSLVEAHPDLSVHILVWSTAVIHGPSKVAPAILGAEWQDHPRIHMKLDTQHPLYAAHHQKIVCVDGRLAFVGGIDLTVRRWDEPSHDPANPLRIDDGEAYPPVHDVQMLVEGDVARVLREISEGRWHFATGERVRLDDGGPDDLWPPDLIPDFADVDVAVSRSEPALRGRRETVEAANATIDIIGAARSSIYIEAQYLASDMIGDALTEQLTKPQGPDIVIVMTHESRGIIERFAMAANRDRLIHRLVGLDREKRLRVVFPVVPSPDGPQQVLIHSKLVIVDDRFLKLGSSNLNNRSIALDTECDLTVEARNDTDRRTIAGIRNRLLGEHLGAMSEEVAQMLTRDQRLCAMVDRLNTGPRGLRPFEATDGRGPSRPVLLTPLLDPARPFRLPWPFG
ncbi:MAG: phospholipase [Rhizobiaceae bacterium]|nr:phospholipase [Rhizobiaceae bacterium]MCV0407462.1 phospholipase [Rhizobiaceae bacterium]